MNSSEFDACDPELVIAERLDWALEAAAGEPCIDRTAQFQARPVGSVGIAKLVNHQGFTNADTLAVSRRHLEFFQGSFYVPHYVPHAALSLRIAKLSTKDSPGGVRNRD
jgi:hypothetical protein